ncbi:unnamed protein product [Owenia fusiformis]|uniref:Uncharacterized protein n=1 Tax=Owenia fusiformis TaxID=6347 RepID=A0A8J1XZX1_OWEFU|nr:unnamed protein product [Owenia fusiformis]
MPSGRNKDRKEDTWKESDLKKSIKEANDEKPHKKHRDKDREREHRKKDRHNEDINGEDKEKKHRRRKDENEGGSRERRHKERRERHDENGDDDRERRHRRSKDAEEDDDERRKRKEERRKRKEEDGDRDKDKERRRRKENEENGDDREHRRRKKENDGDDDKERRRRHRDKENDDRDDDKERRRRHRDKENDDGDDDRRRRHREKDEEGDDKERRRRHRDKENETEEEREKRRERRKHREDEDDDERRMRKEEKRRNKDGEDDKDKERKHRRDRDNDDERKHRKHRDEEDDGDRERRRAERKERKKREESQNIGDQEVSEKSGKHRDRDKKSRKDEAEIEHYEPPTPVQSDTVVNMGSNDANEDEYNYDDDFEDYEDDFEDDDDNEQKGSGVTLSRSSETKSPGYYKSFGWDASAASNSEMDEIMKAMNEENDRLMSESRKSNWSDSTDVSDERKISRPTTGHSRTFINFVSAKQRQISQKVANKTKKRSEELSAMIDLDVAGFEMFDMPPVKEYELYMRSFGRSNTTQAYIQTGDDDVDREIQTEEIDTRDKWSQHPGEGTKSSGGAEGEVGADNEEEKEKPVDVQSLGKFLAKAGQAISVLLEEQSALDHQLQASESRSNIPFSDSYTILGNTPFLQGRQVIHSQFATMQSNLFLAVYSRPKQVSPGDILSNKGLVCLWNIHEPSAPQKILACESQPTCCCFSPNKAHLAFAGMSDGSLVVWDLRENPSLHKHITLADKEWLVRYPTYSTAGILQYDNHNSAVTSILPVISPQDKVSKGSHASDSDGLGSGLSFQLASMEEQAVLNLWVVAEIVTADEAGSESDLGLAPGGRIKLLKSSAVHLENPVKTFKASLRAYEMQLLPSDPSHFYVGTDSGYVVHGVRYGGKAPPKGYKPEIEAPVEVFCLDFNPFSFPIFLAGCADGSIRLHNIHSENAAICWADSTEGRSIVSVHWSRSRPSMFYAVDTDSMIYAWDLLMDDACPIQVHEISDGLTSVCLCNDHKATNKVSPGQKPQMALCRSEGNVEIHSFKQEFSAQGTDELTTFQNYLDRII